jgi:hypothetical protein
MDIVALFCEIADFCVAFEPWLARQQLGNRQRQRESRMYLCEVMTILVYFHLEGHRNFKQYYTEYVCKHLRWAFPRLVSYSRFVELQGAALLPLCAYLQQRKGPCTGISYIDSTALAVCHPRRISQHRVFAEVAQRGKSSLGWFYGFKLHLVVNDEGELLSCCLTPANTDDGEAGAKRHRRPVPELVTGLWGKLFADKGYLGQALFETLFDQRLQLITKLRKNMHNKLVPLLDQILLRKRAIIETITDQLKNISQIEHTRHRSLTNFFGNLLAGLIAYTWRPKKPSLRIRLDDALLPVAIF